MTERKAELEAIAQAGVVADEVHKPNFTNLPTACQISPSRFRPVGRPGRTSDRACPAESIFYIQQRKIKVSVVSVQGKEAVVAFLASRGLHRRGL
jgi:hypothetical protein